MTRKEITDYLLKFDNVEKYPLLEKFIHIRINKKITIKEQKFLILEPLVYHIAGIENGTMNMEDFVFENSLLTRDEIQYLPISAFKQLQTEIFNLTDEDSKEEDNNPKKK
jgi:hypothetical protein